MLFGSCNSKAQNQAEFIDNIRNQYQIPAIAYAVVKSDSVIELGINGQSKIYVDKKISSANRFHIGSNTKAITSLIASNLVREGVLKWNTSLFEIFPEFKQSQVQYDYTFSDLLNFKTPLSAFSYNTEIPYSIYADKTNTEQRYHIAQYLLQQKPVEQSEKKLYLTNTGYVLAGLMMEKASGKTYEQLVSDLGKELNVNFQFGNPNTSDTNQTFGHDENAKPIKEQSIKLNWLLASGNINISFADYVKFIQFYLQAMQGESAICSIQQMDYLLKNPEFSFGWFKDIDEDTKSNVYHNFGNANGFMSSVIILKEQEVAIIVFANKASEQTEEGITEITNTLKNKYGS